MQQDLNELWRRFTMEIIPQFAEMNSWIRPKTEIEVGDLVVYLSHRNRGQWPLAKVTAVRKTIRDGIVRTVLIKFKGRIYERSVSQVLRLEVTSIWEELRRDAGAAPRRVEIGPQERPFKVTDCSEAEPTAPVAVPVVDRDSVREEDVDTGNTSPDKAGVDKTQTN